MKPTIRIVNTELYELLEKRLREPAVSRPKLVEFLRKKSVLDETDDKPRKP